MEGCEGGIEVEGGKTHTQTRTHRDTHTDTYTHRDTHTHRDTYRDTHTETHTETHTQTHTHIETHRHRQKVLNLPLHRRLESLCYVYQSAQGVEGTYQKHVWYLCSCSRDSVLYGQGSYNAWEMLWVDKGK